MDIDSDADLNSIQFPSFSALCSAVASNPLQPLGPVQGDDTNNLTADVNARNGSAAPSPTSPLAASFDILVPILGDGHPAACPSQHARLRHDCEHLAQETTELQEYIEYIEAARSSPHSGTQAVNQAKYLKTRKEYLTRLQLALKTEMESLQLDVDSYRRRNKALEDLRDNLQESIRTALDGLCRLTARLQHSLA